MALCYSLHAGGSPSPIRGKCCLHYTLYVNTRPLSHLQTVTWTPYDASARAIMGAQCAWHVVRTVPPTLRAGTLPCSLNRPIILCAHGQWCRREWRWKHNQVTLSNFVARYECWHTVLLVLNRCCGSSLAMRQQIAAAIDLDTSPQDPTLCAKFDILKDTGFLHFRELLKW